ncbi:hypothetical protein G9A89_013431 [Geosiphon pyriformis]|nr:hypothetical protein G9A89_013431 [Geosiphon pyriformis]
MAWRLDKAIFRMRGKVMHLQSEIHQKSVIFFTHEFNAIVIPPFEVDHLQEKLSGKCIIASTMPDQQGRGIRGRFHVIIQNEAYTSTFIVNLATFKESEGLKCTTAGMVGL